MKLNYSYGTTDNNGNVQSQTRTIPGVTLPFVQNYTYDPLNRLQIADEKPSGWTQSNCDSDPSKCWKQTFSFDRCGNRNFDEANTTTLPKNCGTAPSLTVCAADKKIVNPAVNTANNRLSTSDNYAFDSVGNTTGDAEGRTFVYDAENKQVSVSDTNGTIGQYSYDGDGKRIKKYVPGTGETTVFVYDAGGKLIQEHSTIVQPVQDAKTVYTTNDHLGSPRINTDATGQVISRHDYHPFGEEIDRTSFSYGSDTIRKQFTGYERDGETGLDFAQARYFRAELGRFLITDPVLILFERQLDPQTINLYVYCRNNPTGYIDPTGMVLDPATWDKSARKAFENYVDYLNKDPKKNAAELATLEQLRKSDVNYVMQLDQSGTDFSNGKEGGVTTNGSDVFINIANQGNGSEKISLNATIGHELEHARQFDSGEWGFHSDKNGDFMDKNGKFVGGYLGTDITDEVKAWTITANLAIAPDFMAKGGSPDPEFQFRVLDEFNRKSDKGGVLAKIATNYAKMATSDQPFPVRANQKSGTLLRPGALYPTRDGSRVKVYGRVR